MKRLYALVLFIFFSIASHAQEYNPFHQTLVDQVNKNNIVQNLQSFVNFGVKEMGTTAQQNALDWMVGLYQSWGYTSIEKQQVNAYGVIGYNLIVTKIGTVYPDKFIVIDAHYDTINGVGANDNGSGTVILLELAKILKNIPTEYSIKFIHFTAEEWGLIGSYQYVDNIVIPQNLDIKLVLNIDQVGGVNGEVNDTITCERDESSPNHNNSDSNQATQQLATCMSLYSNLDTHISNAYGSDYVPFQEEGFVITGLYEYNESPYPHTSGDTMAHMDTEYLFQVAKGTMGALSYFAKAYQTMSVSDLDNQKLKVAPNPADQFLFIQEMDSNQLTPIQLLDLNGRVIYKDQKSLHSDLKINTSTIPNGTYILKVGEFSQKIVVQHK